MDATNTVRAAESVEAFFATYVRSLDDRAFEAWLSLLDDDAFYAVVRYEDHLKDNKLWVLGETKDKLQHRIEAGLDVEYDLRIHIITGVRVDSADDTVKASANFVVVRDAKVTYAGQYHFELIEAGDSLKLKRALVVVQNDKLPEIIYVPI